MQGLRVAVNAEQLLYRSPGGIGRYTAQLLRLLPALAPDCEVVAVAARHGRDQLRAALAGAGAGDLPLAVQALPRPLLYESWNRLAWPPLSGIGRVDVVHAPSLAVAPGRRTPLVVTVHDAAARVHPEAFPRRGRSFHRAGLRAAAARADAVITGSRAAAEEIVTHGAIPADKVRIVPYCVVAPTDVASRPPFGLDGPYVLWVGSLEPRKGVGTLVAAMARLARAGRHPGVVTVLAGYQGWLSSGLVDAADVETLGPSLRQLGPLSEADLWALYRHASLFAFPSRHEGFGLPVLEAMSQATPVVASDIPALRETAGEAAWLVAAERAEEWAEAIAALLDGGATRDRLAAAGPARAAEFSAPAMVAGTVGVYREVGA